MMARMPGTRWLGEHGSSLMTRYDVVCVHTIVGFAPAHAAHFSVHSDGSIDQSRDTRYRSAANLNGNHRVIAIENEDHGVPFGAWSGSDVPALTKAQVGANARILRWAHDVHGVPLQRCPNSRSTSRGLAYHRQGVDGNFAGYAYPGRVSGGEVWSKSFGKVCPGDRRIAQLPEILAAASGAPAPAPIEPVESTEEDDDMPYVIQAKGRAPRLVIGGGLISWDSEARRVSVLNALKNGLGPLKSVTLSVEDFDYLSDRLVTQGDVAAIIDAASSIQGVEELQTAANIGKQIEPGGFLHDKLKALVVEAVQAAGG